MIVFSNKPRLQSFLLRALLLAVLVYAGLCAWIYIRQQTMLFPGHAAPAISDDWEPTVGGNTSESFLDGNCGKLHTAMWDLPGNKGVVLIFHGNAENLVTVEKQVPDFHKLGYAVAAWDYPGYGKSAGCWFDEADLLSDAETAFRWTKRQAGNKPITLYGRSLGSGLALYVASRQPVNKVLLVSPYDSLANVGKDHMPSYIPVEWLILYPLHAYEWIAKVQAPIYAIHGLNDTLITPLRAQTLMRHAGKNADMTWVKNAGHRATELFGTSDHWLEKHL
ncbi:MAG TPA: alpha/beta fold hydrolase [Methylophilaceae bacterium]|nr:alpha/beta fold hydrolase [Methylophilaceae bacterium]